MGEAEPAAGRLRRRRYRCRGPAPLRSPAVRILVTNDEGAVHALEPDRVLLLPDGDEDLWNDGYADLVSLA